MCPSATILPPLTFSMTPGSHLPSPSTSIANLVMDMNQVMPNGQIVIFGFQCDGWSGTWDYTANKGTLEKPIDT
jgi:hypothetical protein